MPDLPTTLVLNPDEVRQDPTIGMDLAMSLRIGHLEIRSAYGTNAVLLNNDQLRRTSVEARARGLSVAVLASPLFKWCQPQATTDRVDSFGFPTRVPAADRAAYVDRAIEVAGLLGTSLVRIFSNLRVEQHLTEPLPNDPLLSKALARAAEAGMTLALENEPVCTLSRAPELLALLSDYGDTGLRLWLDVANLYEVGTATPEKMAALAPHVAYVHIKDYRTHGQGKAFCPAGTGEVPYDALLPVPQAHRPGLPYAIETHVRKTPAEAITSSAAYLRHFFSGKP